MSLRKGLIKLLYDSQQCMSTPPLRFTDIAVPKGNKPIERFKQCVSRGRGREGHSIASDDGDFVVCGRGPKGLSGRGDKVYRAPVLSPWMGKHSFLIGF